MSKSRMFTYATALMASGLLGQSASATSPEFRGPRPALPTIMLDINDREVLGAWQIIELRDIDTDAIITVGELPHPMNVRFRDGMASFSAGCNGVEADTTFADGFLSIAYNLRMTMIACPAETAQRERQMVGALPHEGHYLRLRDRLHLFDADGRLMMSMTRRAD